MRRAVVACTIAIVVVLASCGRKPEEGTTGTPQARPTPFPTPVALTLPLDNQELGIALASVPDDLVPTYNTGPDLMLEDRTRPRQRVFIEARPTAGPLDAGRYHEEARQWAEGYGGGTQLATGTVADTRFGPSAWSSARFWEDGAWYEQVELASPHPSGHGLIVLRAVYPEGSADTRTKLAELEDLLGRISTAPPAAG